MYRPLNNPLSMTTQAVHLKPEFNFVNGREFKSWRTIGSLRGHFKQKGGSEVVISGVKLVSKTITYTCWYNPKLEEKDQLIIDGKTYQITSVEDVEMKHKYIICELSYFDAGA